MLNLNLSWKKTFTKFINRNLNVQVKLIKREKDYGMKDVHRYIL